MADGSLIYGDGPMPLLSSLVSTLVHHQVVVEAAGVPWPPGVEDGAPAFRKFDDSFRIVGMLEFLWAFSAAEKRALLSTKLDEKFMF